MKLLTITAITICLFASTAKAQTKYEPIYRGLNGHSYALPSNILNINSIKEDTINMDYTILDLRGGKAVVLDTTYTAKDNEALQTIRYKFINKPVPDKELTITNYWNGHFKLWEFRSCEFKPYRTSILINNILYFNNN